MDERTRVLHEAIQYAFERHAEGDLTSAETVYYKVLEAEPQNASALQGLGILTCQRGDYANGAEILKAAVLASPNDGNIRSNLGNALRVLGRMKEAKEELLKAVHLEPMMPGAWSNLSLVQREEGEAGAALESGNRAVELEPDLAEAHLNRGCALQSLGRMSEALDAFAEGVKFAPDSTMLWDSLLLGLQYSDQHSAEELFRQAKEFGISVPDAPRPNKRPDLKRIGFVSGDFRNHPVGQFLLAMLREWRPEYAEVYLYSNNGKTDALTSELKDRAAEWRDIERLDDDAAFELIRKDEIDLLVDLAGHTAHNRLTLFAARPAPVQATWLGYSATTGLEQMDWMIGDAWVTPKEHEPFFSERLARLPHTFLCFDPPEDAPLAQPGSEVVFGSFNNPAKISDTTLRMWGRVLDEVPGSRLMLKYRSLDDPASRDALISRAEAQGLDSSRLEIHGYVSRDEHLKMLGSLTAALDTFPYTGATTTVEALWQGVPVATLVGDRYVSRMSASVLSAVGLGDWIAQSEDEYVAKAVSLTQRSTTRGEALRQMVKDSPLTDCDKFAADFWSLLQKIY